jgi:hypothetical protein
MAQFDEAPGKGAKNTRVERSKKIEHTAAD